MRLRLVGITLIAVSLFAIFTAEPPKLSVGEARERMGELQDLTQCYADYHNVVLVEVYFREWTREAPCERYAHRWIVCKPGETLDAVGWATPHGHTVSYWAKWVRGESGGALLFEHTAAHEVCHVTGIWDEAETDACARQTMQQADCRGGER